MTYFCCDEGRREALRDHNEYVLGLHGLDAETPVPEEVLEELWNGIDFLEVMDHELVTPEDPSPPLRQRLLKLHMLNNYHLEELKVENVEIDGGRRIKEIAVDDIEIDGDVVTIELNKRGDFSPYYLRLVASSEKSVVPPSGIDPRLSSVRFSFKVECPSDFDCAPQHVCPPPERTEPAINYLAKDYASFRQLVLDRMATVTPEWQDRNAADVGMVLVELLAYVGDHLSYQQDAVMTEAYLGTARRRISLRRHARLMDYQISEGNNARTWVVLIPDDDYAAAPESEEPYIIPKGTKLLTRTSANSAQLSEDDSALEEATYVFETMIGLRGVYKDHVGMRFYTWSDRECCLPQGATSATLSGHYSNLQVGDYLMFEETKGPKTGVETDANSLHRHVVRLTSVAATDADDQPLTDPLPGDGEENLITEIAWGDEDRLPFPLCVSSETEATDEGGGYMDDISVAHGNVVPVDHGLTVVDDGYDDEEAEEPNGDDIGESDSWKVPAVSSWYAPEADGDPCDRDEPVAVPVRFRPRLEKGPLTYAENSVDTLPENRPPAADLLAWDGRSAEPHIALRERDEEGSTAEWEAWGDLLNSSPHHRHFVVEVDDGGYAVLRFGDGRYGQRPQEGSKFYARYRVGNGASGNIGADSLKHIVIDQGLVTITQVRNPLAARCGRDPESSEDIRHRVPVAFRTQKRAVTAQDYADRAEDHPEVQRAAATIRWTGSWHTVFLTIDRKEGIEVDAEFEEEMLSHLEPYRCAGYDLEIDSPDYVPLEIVMEVCVKPEYLRSDVKQALLTQFSASRLPDGSLGLFHPDRFTFGQPVYVSPLISAAQQTAGVISAKMQTFQRLDTPDPRPLEDGLLTIGRLEIARLDNDPNFRENGVFKLKMQGGQ